MEQLKTKLGSLKSIQPDANFAVRTRHNTTLLPQFKKSLWAHICESMYYSLALGLGALLLIALVGRMSYIHLLNSSPIIIGSLQTKALVNEAELANFKIQIAEAQYFEDTADVIASALHIMRTSTPDHLNDILLEKELQQIEASQPRSS